MSIFKTYINKHATIANGLYSNLNESNNEIVNLFYGNNLFSRHLININLTDFKNKILSNLNTAITPTYTLKFKNSGPSIEELNSSAFANVSNNIAKSFDLVFFQINENFDSGIGYDLDNQYYLTKQPNVNLVLSGYANFLSATTTTSWSEPGVYLNPVSSTTYSIQHFSVGNEDICVDVTNIVNNFISSGNTSINIGICFSKFFESNSDQARYYANFFSDKTRNFFKPYLEANYNDLIIDDRNQVSNNRLNRLFLYTFSGNVATNYYSAGTVNILNSANAVVLSGLTPQNLKTGVYYVDILLPNATIGQNYKDVWQGVTFQPGIDQTNFVQNFTIKNNYYTNNQKQINDYVVDIYGISNNEIIQSEDIKRIYAEIRVNYSTNKPYINPRLDYRIVCSLQEVVGWTQMNTSFFSSDPTSWFDLDTSWLLTDQIYQIQFRINELGTLRTIETVSFRVVNQTNILKPL